jgi:phosphosulfolactate synthase
VNDLTQKTELALGLHLPARQDKPRTRGLTMMIDWGLPCGHQADIVATGGAFVDMAKIAGSIAGLMDEANLLKKLEIYSGAGISTSQGGLFVELAVMQGRVEALFEHLARLGFDAVEVSDNLLDWSLAEKTRVIRTAVEQFGLRVLGEVGKKEGALTDDAVIADLEACFAAGASRVFLEAYELFSDGVIRDELIASIADRFGVERTIFELPVTILPGVNREFKHKVTAWLVKELGTEVNLANVEWDEIWITEMVRRGAGGDTTHPGGAYHLNG